MIVELAQALVAGMCAGGGVWAAIRVEIKYLWKADDDKARRLERIERKLFFGRD